MNQISYGENLYVLRELITLETVDLIYLDPPFNSKREFEKLLRQPNTAEAEMKIALCAFLGEKDMMAYLTMMVNRLAGSHAN